MRRAVSFDRWPWSPENPKQWHIALVNGNIRRFVTAWTHFVLSGNFEELLTEHEENERAYTSPYKYLRLLISGRFVDFGGNDLVDGSGRSADSPLFMNLFDIGTTRGISKEFVIRNYLVLIRVLQYICGANEVVSCDKVFQDLEPFFDREAIHEALKRLLFAGLIEELTQGAKNIGQSTSWTAIELTADCCFERNRTTTLYLNTLLPEFGYIQSMAIVSRQLKNEFNADRSIRRQPYRSVQATLAFLTSLKDIIVANLNDYRSRGVLEQFKRTFYSPIHRNRPWKGATSGALHSVGRLARASPELLNMPEKFAHLLTSGCQEIEASLGAEDVA